MIETSIQLAPNWKRSLTLTHPLILGAGACGYGDALAAGRVGAVVSTPTTLRPRAGPDGPRCVEIPGGVLLRTGAANPGLARVLHDHRREWARREGSPALIVACAAQGAVEWPEMAARLERVPGVAALELHLNPTVDAARAIRAVRAATELPILAKLDLDNAVSVAAACAAAGANALVVGRAPRGLASVDGKEWYGRLYSPAVKPLALRVLADVAAQHLEAPLVGCGGAHSAVDVREFLQTGAAAVEIDSALWVDPQLVLRIAADLGDWNAET